MHHRRSSSLGVPTAALLRPGIILEAGSSSWIEMLSSIDCPESGVCSFVGNVSKPGGSSSMDLIELGWDLRVLQSLALPRSFVGLHSSCSSPSSCMLVGVGKNADALVTQDGGRNWTPVDIGGLQASLVGVHCSSGDCVAFGQARTSKGGLYRSVVGVSLDQGRTWASKVFGSGSTYPVDVACPTQLSCVAALGAHFPNQ